MCDVGQSIVADQGRDHSGSCNRRSYVQGKITFVIIFYFAWSASVVVVSCVLFVSTV